jgi:hypothetical protein
MFWTWLAAVVSLMNDCSAIARLLGPGAEAPQHIDLPGWSAIGTAVYTVPFAAMGCEHAGDSAKTPRLRD